MPSYRHSVGPFSVLAALAIGGWAYLTSNDQPSGCYRVDGSRVLVVTNGEVILYGDGALMQRTNITEVRQIRGYVLTLASDLNLDPIERSVTESGKPGAGNNASLVIFEDGRDAPHVRYEHQNGSRLKFYEIECEPAKAARR